MSTTPQAPPDNHGPSHIKPLNDPNPVQWPASFWETMTDFGANGYLLSQISYPGLPQVNFQVICFPRRAPGYTIPLHWRQAHGRHEFLYQEVWHTAPILCPVFQGPPKFERFDWDRDSFFRDIQPDHVSFWFTLGAEDTTKKSIQKEMTKFPYMCDSTIFMLIHRAPPCLASGIRVAPTFALSGMMMRDLLLNRANQHLGESNPSQYHILQQLVRQQYRHEPQQFKTLAPRPQWEQN